MMLGRYIQRTIVRVIRCPIGYRLSCCHDDRLCHGAHKTCPQRAQRIWLVQLYPPAALLAEPLQDAVLLDLRLFQVELTHLRKRLLP